jgi:hypothetical protein
MQKFEQKTIQIPADVEGAIEELVVQHLQSELGTRGLLLTAEAMDQAKAEAALLGQALLAGFIERCYGINRQTDSAVSFQFQSEESCSHVQAALAFGATAAHLLTPPARHDGKDIKRSELVCAIFNLGIGLVDSLCDGDSQIGMNLLGSLNGEKLMDCAEKPQKRGWLRTVLPAAIGRDAAIAFAADLIEVFFQELHTVYPGDHRLDMRRYIGRQLATALAAERDSVCWSQDTGARERSLQSSRLTSILPLQIIETLARGHAATEAKTAGTLLGEALWRIDDLVDLCQDARSGALNSLLLFAMNDPSQVIKGYDPVAALKRLLVSKEIAQTAAEAAVCLASALGIAGGVWATRPGGAIPAFLHFVQSYAGVLPAEES